MSTTTTPLPKYAMLAIVLVNCAEATNIVFIFPFMAFMLEDMGYFGHRLGYFAGGLAASFCSGQFFSSVGWGYLSDYYGRKPALVFGTLGTGLGTMIFGFSSNYYQAVIGRFLSGVLSGNLGILKSYLTEITDDSNRSNGFVFFQMSTSIGNIIGPLIGGMLCKPADKYPHIFPLDSVWGRHPYLLPCLICFVNSVISALMCLLFMEESGSVGGKGSKAAGGHIVGSSSVEALPRRARDRGVSADGTDIDTELEMVPLREDMPSLSSVSLSADSAAPIEGLLAAEALDTTAVKPKPTFPQRLHDSLNRIYRRQSKLNDNKQYAMLSGEDLLERAPLHSSHSGNPADRDLEEAGAAAELDAAGEQRPAEGLPPSPPTPSPSVLADPNVLNATINYGLVALSYILLDETLPLFMKLDVGAGGFSFDSTQIGLLLSLSGATMLLFNGVILPTIAKQKKTWLFRWSNFLAIPFTVAWPLLGLMHRALMRDSSAAQRYLFWGILLFVSTVKNILATTTFTAVIMLVNHTVSSEHLGKVNGLGQSLAALARAVGPAAGGALWSLSLQIHFVSLNFLVASLALISCQYLNFSLPDSLNYTKVAEAVDEK